jgi:subtilase family serine protease
MNKNSLRLIVIIIFFALTLLYRNQPFSAETENSPIIHIDQTEHTFPTALVGKTLSHTFTVSNQGKADLNIKDVTHS